MRFAPAAGLATMMARNPKRFIAVDQGDIEFDIVARVNPQFISWDAEHGHHSLLTLQQSSEALCVISSIQQLVTLNDELKRKTTLDRDSYALAVLMGDGLEEVFVEYELPIGMINKLEPIRRRDGFVIFVNNHEVMNSPSPNTDAATGVPLSR
jgi:hypothetical protein